MYMRQKSAQFMCPFSYYMMKCPYLTSQRNYRQRFPDLSGDWCGYNPHIPRMGPAKIEQHGDTLIFHSEAHTRAEGYFINDNKAVKVPLWEDGLIGDIINGSPQAIKWRNGTIWTKGVCDCNDLKEYWKVT